MLSALLLAALAIEAGVRVVMPVNLDFYNWQKIKRVAAPPKTGFEFIPGSRNDFYVGVPVEINNVGLRDVELEPGKPPGTVRILVIGDSVTFGYGVRLEDTFLKVLESELNEAATGTTHYRVINGGMDGSGLDRHYEFLRSSAPGLEPDLVIIALSLNDVADYAARGHEPVSREFSERSLVRRLNTFLLFHSQAYLRSYLHLKALLYRHDVIDFDEEHWYEVDILKAPTDRMHAAWDSTRELLADIVALGRDRGYPVAFVVFPMEMQLDRASLELYQRELRLEVTADALRGDPQHEIVRFGASLETPVLDLLPAFRAAPDSPLFLRGRSMPADPVHPSEAGHRVAGHALFDFLLNQPALAALPWPEPPRRRAETTGIRRAN